MQESPIKSNIDENLKIEVDKNDVETLKGDMDENWFKCPHCRGKGGHCDWCPWFVRAIGTKSETAPTLRYTCQYCKGFKHHQSDCWWKLKYGSIEPKLLYRNLCPYCRCTGKCYEWCSNPDKYKP